MTDKDIFSGRLKALSVVVVLVIVVLIARMGYLQVYDGDYYASLADGNRIRLVPAVAPRGTMYDRNGKLLVTNHPGFTVSLLPLTEPISEEVISRLSTLLNVPVEDIHKKIDSHVGFDPIRIKTDVGPELTTIIAEQKDLYPGVVVEVLPIRDYIYHQQGAHAYGYVSEISDAELEKKKDEGYKSGDIIGKFGLEKIYDQYLRGTNGGEQVEVDVTGKPVQVLGKKNPIPGNDLHLTIDLDIQAAAEKAVDEQLVQIGAHAAAAVALNPQTGEVLAIVSRPAFDPNLFVNGISGKDWAVINNNPYYPMDNKAITGEYPPGSTFKIITGTAALSEGKVTPEEKIFDSGHHWIIPKGNAGGEALGWLNFEQAMAHSDNVYFYEMGNRLGIDIIERYARMFGMGKLTGIDLPYESEGLVACKAYKQRVFEEDWYLAETFDAAIGQGFNLVTPIQAASIMGEIAADGKRFKPYLVDSIVGHQVWRVAKFQHPLFIRRSGPNLACRRSEHTVLHGTPDHLELRAGQTGHHRAAVIFDDLHIRRCRAARRAADGIGVILDFNTSAACRRIPFPMGVVFDIDCFARFGEDFCVIFDGHRLIIRNGDTQRIALHRRVKPHGFLRVAVDHGDGQRVQLQRVAEGIHYRQRIRAFQQIFAKRIDSDRKGKRSAALIHRLF